MFTRDFVTYNLLIKGGKEEKSGKKKKIWELNTGLLPMQGFFGVLNIM